jgi:hypothetical protein
MKCGRRGVAHPASAALQRNESIIARLTLHPFTSSNSRAPSTAKTRSPSPTSVGADARSRSRAAILRAGVQAPSFYGAGF